MTTTQSYPQAPALTDAELDELLTTAQVARIGTQNPDGTVHLTSMWYLYDRPDILLGTQAISRKVRYIVRDPRVTVLVDITEPNLVGAVLYGTATVERDGAQERRVEIFRKYKPEDEARTFAATLAGMWEPVVIRIRPHAVTSFDYRKGFPR